MMAYTSAECTYLRVSAILVASFLLAPSVKEAKAEAPACQYDIGTQAVIDNETQLEWERGDSNAGSEGAADSYCDSLQIMGVDNMLKLDWRVPTVLEWQSIIDDSRTNPALDPVAFPGVSSTYWTSSQQGTSSWTVQAFDGTTGTGSIAQKVRCVRNAG